jgi:hypothetical protein
MSQGETIIDYASPRKRTALRMAARSTLEWRWVGHGLLVRERLADQAQALVTIVASALPVGAVFPAALSGVRFSPGVLILPAVIFSVWLVVVLMVVQQSWGRTELTLVDGRVRLYTGGPLSHRTYAWGFDEVHAVRVVPLGGQWDAWPLGEIEILAAGSTLVRLFTDHPERRLVEVGTAIELALRGERPQGVTAVPVAAVPIESGERGEPQAVQEVRPDLSRFRFSSTRPDQGGGPDHG